MSQRDLFLFCKILMTFLVLQLHYEAACGYCYYDSADEDLHLNDGCSYFSSDSGEVKLTFGSKTTTKCGDKFEIDDTHTAPRFQWLDTASSAYYELFLLRKLPMDTEHKFFIHWSVYDLEVSKLTSGLLDSSEYESAYMAPDNTSSETRYHFYLLRHHFDWAPYRTDRLERMSLRILGISTGRKILNEGMALYRNQSSFCNVAVGFEFVVAPKRDTNPAMDIDSSCRLYSHNGLLAISLFITCLLPSALLSKRINH